MFYQFCCCLSMFLLHKLLLIAHTDPIIFLLNTIYHVGMFLSQNIPLCRPKGAPSCLKPDWCFIFCDVVQFYCLVQYLYLLTRAIPWSFTSNESSVLMLVMNFSLCIFKSLSLFLLFTSFICTSKSLAEEVIEPHHLQSIDLITFLHR